MIMGLFLTIFAIHLVTLGMNFEHAMGTSDASGFFTFWLVLINLGLFVYFGSQTINLFLVGA